MGLKAVGRAGEFAAIHDHVGVAAAQTIGRGPERRALDAAISKMADALPIDLDGPRAAGNVAGATGKRATARKGAEHGFRA